MKPVILITLHRRYHELLRTIKNIESKKRFFKENPSVFVIWADPEPSRYWLIKKLLDNKKIELLITRYRLPKEDGKQPTTFYESQNIRIGLENVFRKYPDAFCIVQASDIYITDYGFYLIENEMNNGAKLLTFNWENRFGANALHTNCFAVLNTKELWPPFAPLGGIDVLERLWYINLENNLMLKNNTLMSNSNNICFLHEHISEHLEQIPFIPLVQNNNLRLNIRGNKSIFRIILDFIRCII